MTKSRDYVNLICTIKAKVYVYHNTIWVKKAIRGQMQPFRLNKEGTGQPSQFLRRETRDRMNRYHDRISQSIHNPIDLSQQK